MDGASRATSPRPSSSTSAPRGGSACGAEAGQAGCCGGFSLDQLRDGLLEGGYAAAADLDVAAAALDDPGFSFMSQYMLLLARSYRPTPTSSPNSSAHDSPTPASARL